MNKIPQWQQQWQQRRPAGAPLLPLLPLLWYLIHSCSLAYVTYYFIFGIIYYLINHFTLQHLFEKQISSKLLASENPSVRIDVLSGKYKRL